MPDIFYFFNSFVNLDVYLLLQGSRFGRAGRREPGHRAPSTGRQGAGGAAAQGLKHKRRYQTFSFGPNLLKPCIQVAEMYV